MNNPVHVPGDDTGARLPFCPRCRYSLRGLPGAGRCPECGLEYDDQSRMWVETIELRHAFARRMLIPVVFWCLYGIGGTVFLFSMSRIQQRGFAPFVGMILFNGILSVGLYYRFRSAPLRYLSILPEGLWSCTHPWRSRFIPWSQIESAVVRPGRKTPDVRIRLHPDGEIRLSRMTLQFVADPREAAARINAHIARARSAIWNAKES